MYGLKSSVLLPLYIYPLPNAWNPLYSAIESHPALDFTIIINPHNGPGETALPNEDYAREIARLNQYPSVSLVGYVSVSWGQRDLEKVFQDIDKYAAWGKHGSGELTMQGIFFDEAPNHFDDQRKGFLDAADERVKNADGLGGFRLTIHNPGTVPDTEYANPGPDLTTVFETEYLHFQDAEVQLRLTNLLRYDRDRCSYMVLCVPKDHVSDLVRELKRRAKYIYVSECESGWYEKFGEGWDRFIEAVASDS